MLIRRHSQANTTCPDKEMHPVADGLVCLASANRRVPSSSSLIGAKRAHRGLMQQWLLRSPEEVALRSALGASRPLPRVAATICFLITERALFIFSKSPMSDATF